MNETFWLGVFAGMIGTLCVNGLCTFVFVCWVLRPTQIRNRKS